MFLMAYRAIPFKDRLVLHDLPLGHEKGVRISQSGDLGGHFFRVINISKEYLKEYCLEPVELLNYSKYEKEEFQERLRRRIGCELDGVLRYAEISYETVRGAFVHARVVELENLVAEPSPKRKVFGQ